MQWNRLNIQSVQLWIDMNFLWYSVKISAVANPCHNLMVRPIISSDWLTIFLLRLILPRWWPVFELSGSMAMVYFFLWQVFLAARLWPKLPNRLYRKDNHSSVRAGHIIFWPLPHHDRRQARLQFSLCYDPELWWSIFFESRKCHIWSISISFTPAETTGSASVSAGWRTHW